MSYEREEKTREVEDAPKQPSQDEIGGAEVSETTAFDRIVASAKQEAEVDADLVPSAGDVSAAPKVSKTGVEESAEAIRASAMLVAARLNATAARLTSLRTTPPRAELGPDWQREEIERTFTEEVGSLGLETLQHQLVQHRTRVQGKLKVSQAVREGVQAIEHALHLVRKEVLVCRQAFSGIALDDVGLAAKVEELDDALGLSLERGTPTKLSVAKAAADAVNEVVEAIKANAQLIQSAVKVATWGDDQRHVLMELAGHTRALAALARDADKAGKRRANGALTVLKTMFRAVGQRSDSETELGELKKQMSRLAGAV